MNKNKELAKNTIIIFIGTLCTKFVSFFLLPLYTGLLSTSEFGIVDLITTLIALISPIISLQISQGVFRFLIDNRKNDIRKKEIISSSFFFITVSVFICFIIYIVFSLFFNNNYKYYFVIIVVSSIYCDLFLQISRGLGNNKVYSIAGVITATTTILFNIIFLKFLHMKVDGMLLGTLIGYVTGILYLYFKMKMSHEISIHYCKKENVIKLLKYSLPLVPNQLSWWIFSMSDRIIVSVMLGLSYTGILSVSYKFSNTFIMLYNIFNISWTESIALHINDEDINDFFNSFFNKMLLFFSSVGILFIATLPFAFGFLVNENFNESYNLIPIGILASICQVVVGLVSVVYVSKNDTKAIAYTAIFAAIINITVHLLLINFIGLYAAIVSTFISYFVFSIYRTMDVSKKYLKIKIYRRHLYSVGIIIIVILSYYYSNTVCRIFSVIISLLYTIIINKDFIIYLTKSLKSKIRKEV